MLVIFVSNKMGGKDGYQGKLGAAVIWHLYLFSRGNLAFYISEK